VIGQRLTDRSTDVVEPPSEESDGADGTAHERVRHDVNEKVAALLLDCLHQDAGRVERGRLSELTSDEWQSLRMLARAHRVQELLLHRLTSRRLDAMVPEPILEALRDARRRGAARNLGLLHDLDRASAALHASGIPVIVLKGAHLASVVYASVELRSMVDIDLLVRADDLGRAGAALQAQGYQPLAPYGHGADLTASYPYHLPRFVRTGAIGIELHWRLAPPNPFCDAADLWTRAVPLRIGDRDLLALGPEDLLLHLCAHASYKHHFEMGLRPSCDVAETIHRHDGRLNWPATVARARQWRWDRGTYLSLRLAKDMLGAAIPDEVLTALRPAAFDESLVAMARTVTLRDSSTNRAIPPSLVRMTRATAPGRRIVELWRRIFLPRAVVAEQYAVSPASLSVWFYYPVRFKDLLTRHGRVAIRLLRGDPILTPMAAQKAAIQDWLAHNE
jgi:hypothetical protein